MEDTVSFWVATIAAYITLIDFIVKVVKAFRRIRNSKSPKKKCKSKRKK